MILAVIALAVSVMSAVVGALCIWDIRRTIRETDQILAETTRTLAATELTLDATRRRVDALRNVAVDHRPGGAR